MGRRKIARQEILISRKHQERKEEDMLKGTPAQKQQKYLSAEMFAIASS